MDKVLRILSYPAFERAEWNPYNALLCFELAALGHQVTDFSWRRLRKEQWDVVHIHWPHFLIDRGSRLGLWRSARKALRLLDEAKRQGAKIVWTAHNVLPHEVSYPDAEMAFMHAFFSRLDGLIALSHAGMEEARARWPNLRGLPAFVIPHGHYREVYPRPFDRIEARRRLGLEQDATVACWIGMIRPYKNVETLIKAFRSISDPQLVLTIGGKPSDQIIAAAVTKAAGEDPRIKLKLKFLPDFEIAWHLIAADLIVLPYTTMQNSGSALLALSFDRPLVVPDMGAMPELRNSVGAEWIRTFTGSFQSKVLVEAIQWSRTTLRSMAPLQDFEWRQIACQTAEAFSSICGSASTRTIS